jgi:hypothetical protein
MRMFNKSLISVSALLALGALGCGDSGDDTPNTPVNQGDSGVGGGTGMDAGINLNQCQTVFGITGKLCTQANGQQGYQTCVGGVPQGACNPISLGGDGGTTGQLPFDAAALFDGALPQLEAGAIKCPTGYKCGILAQGFGACVEENAQPLPIVNIAFPPSCTTAGTSCSLGSESAQCQAVPGFDFLGTFCTKICN